MKTFAILTRRVPETFTNQRWVYREYSFQVEVMATVGLYSMVKRKGALPFVTTAETLGTFVTRRTWPREASEAGSVPSGNAVLPPTGVSTLNPSPSPSPVSVVTGVRENMTEIGFFVPGFPAPGGSKTAFPIHKKHGLEASCAEVSGWKPSSDKPCPTCGFTGRVAVSDAGGERTKEWRQQVSAAAMEAMKQANSVPLTGAIEVEFIFQMPRPKSHFASNSIALRPSAPLQHVTRPDCLKLARSTEDAMTGKCYADDAQIVKETISKAFGGQPGCWIIIREAE